MNKVLLGWLLFANIYTFFLFRWDKFRAGKPGASRIPELHLLTASALGGWAGSFMAMMLFRHKTAKRSFKVKFVFALFVLLGLLALFLPQIT